MADLTRILQSIEEGSPQAAEALLPLVYDELRRLAASKLAREAVNHTLQPTALLHDAWLRLAGKNDPGWENRGHFFAAAAEAMRRILIDRARKREVRRRNGLEPAGDAELGHIVVKSPDEELLAVNDALDKLATFDKQAADLVKLRYFLGMNMQEASESLNLPKRTTERLWSYAKSWLRNEIQKDLT